MNAAFHHHDIIKYILHTEIHSINSLTFIVFLKRTISKLTIFIRTWTYIHLSDVRIRYVTYVCCIPIYIYSIIRIKHDK